MVEGYPEPRDNTPDTKNTVVCKHNWPAEYRKLKVQGNECPSITNDCF